MKIKPGQTVNVIIKIDYQKEIVEIKDSVVLDVIDNKTIIAQTKPHISKENLNKEVYVTYLEKKDGKPVRYGFPATIIEFIKDSKPASKNKTQAIVLLRKGPWEQYNLRMFYRHEPPRNCGIDIFVCGNRVSILDISIDGVSFSHNNVPPIKVNEEIKTILVIGDKATQVKAKVVRVGQAENEMVKKKIKFISTRFLDIDGQTKKELGKKIWDIERVLHYKETNHKPE
ncbi:MAG: putative cytosolic protein [Deltaproteobacteria bacterium]|nr:putative cytosolic protein [Deltaproteobacteria bacterium]